MRDIFNVRIITPDSETFSRTVELYEKKYQKLERVYKDVFVKLQIEEFSHLNKEYLLSILNQYLFKWGKMARVLGLKGCETLANKLIQMESQLENFRQESLSTIDLRKKTEQILAGKTFCPLQQDLFHCDEHPLFDSKYNLKLFCRPGKAVAHCNKGKSCLSVRGFNCKSGIVDIGLAVSVRLDHEVRLPLGGHLHEGL